ncbi:MAG: TonB-dependent receptor [Pseudoxanthomonas suwonensis]|nr:TonB-dependent receptor [Pseudoxanthomonas suwonensis]
MTPSRSLLSFAICAALASATLPAMANDGAATAASAQSSVALAAQQAGTIHGRVFDAGSNDALPGAIVRVVDSGLETSSNRDGQFQLPPLPAGRHELRIDYIGYASRTVSVEVREGERVRVDSPMTVGEALQTVQVVGYRGAQARSMAQQRAADGVVNVVSSDTLGQFPDVSVAESVARIAGVAVTRHRGEADAAVIRGGDPSWTRVSLDGLSMPDAGGGRQVALGQLTSEVLSSVEITKAPTPDMDADAIGGTINIVTRGALSARSGVSGKLSRGYSELGKDWNHDVSIGYSDVFGEVNQHGFMFNVSQNVMDREMNNKETSHRLLKADGQFYPDRLQTKAYNILRERGAIELRYDFQNADQDRHYFAGYTLSEYLADEDRHTVIIRNRSADKFIEGSDPIHGIWPGTRIEQNWTDRHDQSKRHLLVFGANNHYDAFSLEFRGAVGRAENIRKPNRTSWAYRGDFNDRQLRYDYTDPDFPVLTFVETGETPNVGGNVALDDLTFRYGSNYLNERWEDENSLQAQLKIEVPMDFGANAGFLRFGGKFSSRDRDSDENRYTILAGAPLLSEIVGDEPINNFGRFPFGYRFNKSATKKWPYGMTTEQTIENSWANDFSIKEDIAAAYGMGVFDTGDWRLVGGVRVEHTRTDSQGWISHDNWSSRPDPTRFERSYTNWFPSLHARYNVGENVVMRASYSTGIARPSFSNLRPTVSINRGEGGGDGSINARNMDLKPALSQALDLMVEYYIEPIGLLSAGVFAKRIKDVHFDMNRVAAPGETFQGFVVPDDGRTWRVSEVVNADEAATIYGAELSWDQALTFLPAPFDGFGVFANYSYIKTESTTPAGDKAPLGLQPEHTYNLAVYYEKGPFSTRLAWNNQTRGVSEFGDGTAGDFLWWDERGILDWTARYQFSDSFGVFAEASNLTDSRARRYRGDRQRVEELEDFGRSYNIGIRFRF